MSGRLYPSHKGWNQDLPLRVSQEQKALPSLHRELNAIDEQMVELGREAVLVRGLFLALSLFAVGMVIFQLWAVFAYFGPHPVALLSVLFCTALALATYRLDASIWRQAPVRFNRLNGKVYWCVQSFGKIPLGRWEAKIKVWDWNTVEAEILKMAGYNGKVYMVRYYLSLATCKPGTHTALDREVLLGPSMTTVEFEQAWAFLRKYMEHGLEAVPKEPLKDNSIHYIRSLFAYMPWMMFNEWGRAARHDMFCRGWGGAIVSAFVALITLPLLPFFFLLGITNYIALRLAPEPEWPEDIDAESRGITVEELRAEKKRLQQQPKEKPRWSSIIAACLSVVVIGWTVGRFLGLVPPI